MYVQDLLRFFVSVGDLDEAIKHWVEKGGDDAREYALKRELEKVSSDARFVLISFCIPDGPASAAEAKAICGLSYERLQRAVTELQGLFLMPRPAIAEGIPRFSVNANTRALVLRVMQDTKDMDKAKSAVRSMSGDVYRDRSRRAQVSGDIMQATAVVRSGRYVDAESTIKAGLEKVGEDPDLYSALGWVYKSWKPRRTTDARQSFQRSAELKSQYAETYRHWYEMEEQEKNWDGAVNAAEAALAAFKNSVLWTFRHGYALSRYGQDLAAQLQPRAKALLTKADKVLTPLVGSSPLLADTQEEDLHWRTCRALAINACTMYKLSTEEKERERWLTRLAKILDIWLNVHGGDADTKFEVQKLVVWYPPVKDKLNSPAGVNLA